MVQCQASYASGKDIILSHSDKQLMCARAIKSLVVSFYLQRTTYCTNHTQLPIQMHVVHVNILYLRVGCYCSIMNVE